MHEPRGPQYMGINWVGPALMRYGTDEQKAKHLAAIASGDVIWCQGFSEPEAGTDLVSLRTRAVPDGDGWRITGQKVWTSYARMASWCVLAACTDPEAPKHKRLTLFLIPMDRPGFTVRGIPSMLGPHHLNEMFLDDVPAYPGDVLGEAGDGWRVMREALAFERVGHRALRAVRIAARPDAHPTRGEVGRASGDDSHPLGARARRSPRRAAARLSRRLAAGRLRPRARRPAPPGSSPRPATSWSPSCCSTCWDRPRWTAAARPRCTERSKTIGVTHRRPPWHRAPSRCNACWWRETYWGESTGENRSATRHQRLRRRRGQAAHPTGRPAGRAARGDRRRAPRRGPRRLG